MRNREEARGAGGEAVRRREVEHEVSGDKGWDWGGAWGASGRTLGQCGLWRAWSRGETRAAFSFKSIALAARCKTN